MKGQLYRCASLVPEYLFDESLEDIIGTVNTGDTVLRLDDSESEWGRGRYVRILYKGQIGVVRIASLEPLEDSPCF